MAEEPHHVEDLELEIKALREAQLKQSFVLQQLFKKIKIAHDLIVKKDIQIADLEIRAKKLSIDKSKAELKARENELMLDAKQKLWIAQIKEEKSLHSDLLTAVAVADGMNREIAEREKKLIAELEILRSQLEAAGISVPENSGEAAAQNAVDIQGNIDDSPDVHDIPGNQDDVAEKENSPSDKEVDTSPKVVDTTPKVVAASAKVAATSVKVAPSSKTLVTPNHQEKEPKPVTVDAKKREVSLKKGVRPNVKSIIESLERQARPAGDAPVSMVVALPSPKKDAPQPLKDQQHTSNKQAPPAKADDVIDKEKNKMAIDYNETCANKDSLYLLMEKHGGSIRNALLSWCVGRVGSYPNVDVTNFSASWKDGLALCALLHSFIPDQIPYDSLEPRNGERNLKLAVAVAESLGITNTLDIKDMVESSEPNWHRILSYVKEIYKHFEINQ